MPCDEEVKADGVAVVVAVVDDAAEEEEVARAYEIPLVLCETVMILPNVEGGGAMVRDRDGRSWTS